MKESYTTDLSTMRDLPHDLKIATWFLFGDTGVSSETILSVMTGAYKIGKDRHNNSTPRDVWDFARCVKLLELFPEWKCRINEVGTVFPHWASLCAKWDEAEAVYAAIRHLPQETIWKAAEEKLHGMF